MDEIRFDENGIMLRPRRQDACVRRRAAEMALPKIRRWNYLSETDAELIAELMKYIDGHDGYEIVKAMERDRWCGNSALVEIMDSGFIEDALREIEHQWVKCLGIKLDIPLGTKVSWRKKIGVVAGYELESGQYRIQTPEQAEGATWICDAEEVKLVLGEKAA